MSYYNSIANTWILRFDMMKTWALRLALGRYGFKRRVRRGRSRRREKSCQGTRVLVPLRP
jgi:hypothetical protein